MQDSQLIVIHHLLRKHQILVLVRIRLVGLTVVPGLEPALVVVVLALEAARGGCISLRFGHVRGYLSMCLPLARVVWTVDAFCEVCLRTVAVERGSHETGEG